MTRTLLKSALGSMVVLLATLLGGCGGDSSDAGAGARDDAQDPRGVTMRVAAITAVGTPWHDMWVRFEERMREKDLPGLDLQMYVTGQLGSEEATLSNLRRNRIQAGGFSLQGTAATVPELSVILAPFLFDSREEVDYVMDQHLFELFSELFAEKGLHLIQWAEVGWTHIYGKRPILTPDDAAGLAFRSSTAEGARLFGEAAGTDLISIPFPEVVPALQTGLIEAGQSGIGMYALTGIAREATHLTLTRHAFDTGVVIANKRWWDGLPEGIRSAFRDSLDDVTFSRQDVRQVLAEIQAVRFPELGVVTHTLTDEQRDAWRAATAGTHQQIVDQIGGRAGEVYGAIQAGKEAFARSRAGS